MAPFFLRPSVGTWRQPVPLPLWGHVATSAETFAAAATVCVAAAAKTVVADVAAVVGFDFDFAAAVAAPSKLGFDEASHSAPPCCTQPEEKKHPFVPEAFLALPPAPSPQLQRFRKLPSVGSWLQPLLGIEDKPRADAGTLLSLPLPTGQPWKAEFEAHFADFDTSCSSMTAQKASSAASPLTKSFSGGLTSSSGMGLFKLAPPPSPATVMSVGGASPAAELVIFGDDDLSTKAKPAVLAASDGSPTREMLHEELLGTNRADDDDESCLLGDNAASVQAVTRAHTVADDVDSPSDSEAEGQGRFVPAVSREPPPPSLSEAAQAAAVSRAPEPAPEVVPAKAPGSNSAARSPPDSPVPVVGARQASPFSPPSTSEPRIAKVSLPLAASAPAPAASAASAAVAPAGAAPVPAPRAASQLAAAYAAQAGSQPGSGLELPQAPQPPSQQSSASLLDFDSVVSSALDRFFGDNRVWPQVEQEVANTKKKPSQQSCGEQRFRVRVPKPYPGVQYRRTKTLDDRYTRYAENDSIVTGHVEDEGEWLRLNGNIFLPMRVGAVEILERLPEEFGGASKARTGGESVAASGLSWFSCCSASATADAELVVGQAAEWGGQETQTGSDGWRQASVASSGSAPGGSSADADPPQGRDGGAATASGGDGYPAAGDAAASRTPASQRHEEVPDSGQRHRGPLPESICRNPLSNLDAASRHFSDPINPFADTDRTHSTDRHDRRGHSVTRHHQSPLVLPRDSPQDHGAQAYSNPKDIFAS